MSAMQQAEAYFNAWNEHDAAAIAGLFAEGGSYSDPNVPDGVAGGVINFSYERESGYERDRAMAHTARIYEIALEIFGRAKREGRPTSDIADDMAREMLGADC